MRPYLRTRSSGAFRFATGLLAAVAVVGCGTSTPASPTPTATLATSTATVGPVSSAPERPVVGAGESWIVFQSLADEFEPGADQDGIGHDDSVFLVRPDGSGLHRLVPTAFVGSEIRPTWSPDGTRVAFLRARLPRDAVELWVIDADGSNAELLYHCEGPANPASECNSIDYPDWAADGSIYFAHDSGIPPEDGPPLTFELWRYEFGSGTAGPVLTHHDRTVEQPRLSPDASSAVYVSYRNLGSAVEDCALFVVDLATGVEVQVTDWSLFPAYPDWSVDGVIAFNSHDLRLFPQAWVVSSLYTVEPDGQNLTALVEADPSVRATQPRWASDGRGLVYTLVTPDPSDEYGQRHLWYVDADGTNARILAGGVVGTHPELRP